MNRLHPIDCIHTLRLRVKNLRFKDHFITEHDRNVLLLGSNFFITRVFCTGFASPAIYIDSLFLLRNVDWLLYNIVSASGCLTSHVELMATYM